MQIENFMKCQTLFSEEKKKKKATKNIICWIHPESDKG